MNQIWMLLLSTVIGAGGYLAVTFWFRPILRYKEIKYQVAADLIFFANAIEMQKSGGELRDDTLARKEANRRSAADLSAMYSELPALYVWWLKRRNEDPKAASSQLIGLLNESNPNEARVRIQKIRRDLGILVGG